MPAKGFFAAKSIQASRKNQYCSKTFLTFVENDGLHFGFFVL